MIHFRSILIDNRLLKLNKVRSVEMMCVNMNMANIKKMAQYIINKRTIVFAKAASGGRIEEIGDETKVLIYTRPDCSYGRVKESLIRF